MQEKLLGYIASAWIHYNTTIEGPPSPQLMYSVNLNQSQTTFEYAQNGATIVPVNNTRTQCTISALDVSDLPPLLWFSLLVSNVPVWECVYVLCKRKS